jgi:hypothetical protein
MQGHVNRLVAVQAPDCGAGPGSLLLKLVE